MTRTFFIALALLPAAFAQNGISLRDNRDLRLDCSGRRSCEIREDKTSATGTFAVEGVHNGEVSVRGANRADVEIRFRVETDAKSSSEARDILKRIRTRVSPGRVSIEGPQLPNSFWSWIWDPSWSVNVEVLVPHNTAVRVETHNGKIYVSDLSGRVEARTHNGETRLERISGDVRTTSHNGAVSVSDTSGSVDFESHNGPSLISRIGGSVRGVSHNGRAEVELTGTSNSSRRVELENHNGALTLSMPRSFSARVRAESHHGQLTSDFPGTYNSRSDGSELREFNIGSGEASIRLRTHNGAIRLRSL